VRFWLFSLPLLAYPRDAHALSSFLSIAQIETRWYSARIHLDGSGLLWRYGFARRDGDFPAPQAGQLLLSRPRISFSTTPILTIFPLCVFSSRDSLDALLDPSTQLSVSLSGVLLSSSPPFLRLLLIFGCPIYRWNYFFKYLVVTHNNVVAFVITVQCKFISFSSHAASPMLELI
jgi:hypothetical protein